jgi:hypothetical protein
VKTNPLKKGVITDKSAGVGIVSGAMVEQRAIELAIINGRSRHNVLGSDWERARRELTGGDEVDFKEVKLDSIPESEEWDQLPGSKGHNAFEMPSEDEDADGRIDAARMFEEGMNEAEHETMLEAADPPPGRRRRKR